MAMYQLASWQCAPLGSSHEATEPCFNSSSECQESGVLPHPWGWVGGEYPTGWGKWEPTVELGWGWCLPLILFDLLMAFNITDLLYRLRELGVGSTSYVPLFSRSLSIGVNDIWGRPFDPCFVKYLRPIPVSV